MKTIRHLILLFVFSTLSLHGAEQFFLMGPPGAGKGTLTSYLMERGNTVHLCVGDILRKEVANGTPEGNICKEFIERGELVPSEIVFSLFTKYFEKALGATIIVDGMVQSEENVAFFDQLLSDHDLLDSFHYVYLAITEETAEERLLNRFVCSDCQKSFTKKDKHQSCNHCGGEIIKRPDDNEEAIRRRIDRFFNETIYLIDHYRDHEHFYEIDAEIELEELMNLYQELF